MSPETLRLFAELLGQLQISAAHPDFDAQVARISVAKRELAEALEQAETVELDA